VAEGHVERKLVAILAGDVAGYSRLMGADEEGTLRQLKAHRRELVDPKVAEHHGRIVKVTGDGILIEFASVLDAVRCAVDIQDGMAARTADTADDKRILFRIGINVGDVIIDGDDIHGDGVNVAARLEAIAEPGGICVSRVVRDQIRDRLMFGFEDMGEQAVKNIVRPIRVFRIKNAVLPVIGTPRPATTAAPAAAKPLPPPDKPSVAVLPFQNLSGDPEQEFFADGMVEDIITALSRIRWFFVIARNSSFAWKGKPVDVRQAGRELGVRYVLEGSVRKAGNRVRITAQLIDVENGAHIWAERYDRDLVDIFAVQDEITTSVVAAIEPKLYAAEKIRIESNPPDSLDAWGCVIRALWHLGRLDPTEINAAKELLARAIELEPKYAKAHALLAWSVGQQIFMGQAERSDALPMAQAAARTAVMLDEGDPWTHFAAGTVHFAARRADDAVASLRKAIDLNPNFALAYQQLGGALVFGGHPEEGLEPIGKGMQMSPLDPFNAQALTWKGFALYFLGRLAEAEGSVRQALQQRPNFPMALRGLAATLAEADRLDEARTALDESMRVEGHDSAQRFAVLLAGRLPYTREADRDRYLGALRKAGLPAA
jgi:TolB-like protein/class 3 adenylate cyclase/Tfp pilus assembly protein PilF